MFFKALHFFSGLLKSIGVSNYTVTHLEELLQYASVIPAVLQVIMLIGYNQCFGYSKMSCHVFEYMSLSSFMQSYSANIHFYDN